MSGADIVQAVLRIEGLPEEALAAAAEFHSTWLKKARDELAEEIDSLVLVLPAAPANHRDWRLAVARDLARHYAPQRVNMVAGDDPAAVNAALTYLKQAAGVTGQLLKTDGQGAGNPAQ